MQANVQASGPSLTTAEVYPIVVEATSQDPLVAQTALGRLKQFEVRPGFFTALFEIVCNKAYTPSSTSSQSGKSAYTSTVLSTQADHVRQLAIIYFKNGVDRYWRKRARHGISEEEKQHLRPNFVALTLAEELPTTFKLLCELTGKTVRLDWPMDCPDLLQQLIQGVTDPASIVTSSAFYANFRSNTSTQEAMDAEVQCARVRALRLLHVCVKVMASKVVNKRQFRNVSGQLFMGVYSIWLEQYQGANRSDPTQWCNVESRTCLKLMRRLLLHGFAALDKIPDAPVVMAAVLRATEDCEARARAIPRPSCSTDGSENSSEYVVYSNAHNTSRLLMKLLLEVQVHHPCTYIPYLAQTTTLAVKRILGGKDQEFVDVRVDVGSGQKFFTGDDYVLLCLRFVKNVVCEVEYLDEDNEDAKRAKREIDSVLTVATLDTLVRILVGQYFLMDKASLENWKNNPESFAQDAADLTILEVRPCAESLYCELVNRCRESVLPSIKNMIIAVFTGNGVSPVDPTDLSAVLLRDAVYNAIGLASYDLHDTFEFKTFLSTTVLPDLNVQTVAITTEPTSTTKAHANYFNYYSIIRRRVAWLLMQWSDACVYTDVEMKHLYVTLLTLHAGPGGTGLGESDANICGVDGGEDTVTRLTANSALRVLIDSVAFRSDSFQDFITPTVGAVFSLLTDMEEDETRMRVLQSLAVILQRCRTQLNAVALNSDGSAGLGWEIAKVLFRLWGEAEDHHLYQVTLVANITSLVESMGSSVGAILPNRGDEDSSLVTPLCTIIAVCTNMSSPAHVYLLDDSVLLWKALVRQLDTANVQLVGLFRRAIDLLESMGTEIVRDVMAVINSYLLLIPEMFFPDYAQTSVQTSGQTHASTSLIRAAIAPTPLVVAQAALSCGQTNISILCDRLVQALDAWKDSGCKLVVDFIDNAIISGGVGVTRGPMRAIVVAMTTRLLAEFSHDGNDIVVAFSSVLARISVQLPVEDLCSILTDAILNLKNTNTSASGKANTMPAHINTAEAAATYGLCMLLKGWVKRLDRTSGYHTRKLIGLALPVVLELVAVRDVGVLRDEFPATIDAIVSIFVSVANETGSDDCMTIKDDPDAWAAEPGELSETSRERLLKQNDAVYRMSLRTTIQARMASLAQSDQNGFRQLLSTVSAPVQKQFSEFMS
eukprot:CFRG2217T1